MQTYNDIVNMLDNGIKLSSGTKLTYQEVVELRRIFLIEDGIDYYNGVVENVDDDEVNEYPSAECLPLDVFEEITYGMRDVPTGDDQIWIVKTVIKRREKKNE